jgi:lipoprotein NlpI
MSFASHPGRVARWLWPTLALCLATSLGAQTPAAPRKAAASTATTSPTPAAASKPAKAANKTPAAAASPPSAPAARSGKGWQVGPIPAWVVAPPVPVAGVTPAPNVGGRREQLVDFQINHALPKPQFFVRIRSVALDPSALGSVSQLQVGFNPAYQTAVLHHASVVRDGQRSERLADARIEPMRREQRLEQQVLDGNETLLVVLADVRVGDAVELAYSVEGENPIFEGRMSGGMRLAYESPVDVLHHRWTAPADRKLLVKNLAWDGSGPERSVDGKHQVLTMTRHQVAGIAQEQFTPPWFKTYPAIDISEYGSWAEVDAWAQRLFALPAPTPSAVAVKAASFKDKGLQGEALVSEVLRFVQDEVRYLSVSLGESSHRPKPPQQTLAELLGDCKDKVVLLNALLRELGFDAKPALVSFMRNKGILNYLPSHELFDHVITRVDLNGRSWYLDATINGQGLALERRGQLPYGAALVVGAGSELQVLPEPPAALNQMEFEHRWDLRQPGRATPFEIVMKTHGLAAERWRAGLASAGQEAMVQALTGGYARILPGLKTVSAAVIQDDRNNNTFEFRQKFEVPDFGTYDRGYLDTEYAAMEMLDVLSGPAETQRRTPFMVDQPRRVDSRILITTPQPLTFNPPAPSEVADRQFRYSARLDLQGPLASFVRRYERRDNQVLPTELSAWREKITQARQISFGRLRLPLFDFAAARPDLEKLERKLRGARGWRNDSLQEILTRNEFGRLIDTLALAKVAPNSTLAAKVLTARAIANNLVADFAAGRTDAEQALAILSDNTEALDALAVAQLGGGKAEEALATFARITPATRSPAVASWMGSIHLLLGRPAEAEVLLRDAVANGNGDEREFALAWLYLAAERQGGRGKAAIEEHVEGTDPKKLTGSLLRYLVGSLDRDGLMRKANEKPEMERLNQAEAHFFIGQRLLAQGQRDEALRAFQRAVDTQATPYREVTFAKLELQRAGR